MKSSKSGKPSSHEEVWAKIEATYTPEELLGLLPYKAVESALFFKRSLAEQIRSKRESSSLTQRELAKMASISQRDVSFLEQAKGNPTITTICRVLYVLELQLQIKTK
jgi:DNA-binding XRE family transcriptional regulator